MIVRRYNPYKSLWIDDQFGLQIQLLTASQRTHP